MAVCMKMRSDLGQFLGHNYKPLIEAQNMYEYTCNRLEEESYRMLSIYKGLYNFRVVTAEKEKNKERKKEIEIQRKKQGMKMNETETFKFGFFHLLRFNRTNTVDYGIAK